MKKITICVVVAIVVFIGLSIIKSCKETFPPKMSQIDSHFVKKDDKLYHCQSYWELIKSFLWQK